MESLIKRSFSHIEYLNTQVFKGSYDILSPTGEIILPEIWDFVVKPGWVVDLHFWESFTAGETSQKEPDVGAPQTALAVESSSTASREPHIEASLNTQLASARRRSSLRTWLGSRKSASSVPL